MLLQPPVRLPSQPLESAEPIRLRRDSPEQTPDFARTLGHARRAAAADQAAVIHFGSRALGLARNPPPPADAAGSGSADDAAAEPSSEEQRTLDGMKRRDREVRAHEQAHQAAGGAYAGAVRLTYQMGPDGKRYAVEGSVPIDVSPVAGDPAATLRKMEVVARAANAPASPSGADRAVAAQAQRMMQQARAQLAAERYARARGLVSNA